MHTASAIRSMLHALAAVGVWLVATLAAAEPTAPTAAQNLRLVPFPKQVTLEHGGYTLGPGLVLEWSAGSGEYPAQLLNAELESAGLSRLRYRAITNAAPAFRIATEQRPLVPPTLPDREEPESYALQIRADEIVCAAKEPAGLLRGVQTLRQLIRANCRDNTLPCLKIGDWPSLRWRCFQDDLTRGPSSTRETLQFEASLGAYLKLNLMTYYMEYQFAFQKHPKIGPATGSLTAQDLRALVEHAKPLHLEVLGNQQSFGHFGGILSHPEYAPLRETSEVLTPVREETYQFLDDLYSEVCPLLPFPWFNVCCDETDGLGTGPSRELAARIGVGGVYVRHIQRVHDLLRDRHHKRMMMWGDIILQHPDHLAQVPRDTIMLSWGYDARPSFESQILPFARSGYEFFVCPGVSDWSRILPDFDVAVTNIHNFIRDGARHGAIGMINTDWEDDGEALKAVKWHADAWAAECAWNASATPIEDFNRRVGAVLFGERGDEFGQAVALLGQCHRLPGMKGMFNSRFWESDFVPKGSTAAIQGTASNLLAVVRPALAHLDTCLAQARQNRHVLETFRLGARRMEFIGQRMVDGLAAAQLYEAARQAPGDGSSLAEVMTLIRRNRDTCALLGRQFATLWLAESKPYALDRTLGRYTNMVNEYDGLLQKLETARVSAAAGKPLPAAEELGLRRPRPLFRRVRLTGSAPEPLAPGLPWADPAATHRLGLVVHSTADDGWDLPVEAELALPPELAGKPVRAFLLGTNDAAQEILAQLDRLEAEGKTRLVLVLPGEVPRNAEARIQVYLGLPRPSTRLPGAVGTTTAPQGSVWLENDRVRLLLGPEGAHIYRWELKDRGNHDVTMPGESGWAGFSDQHPQRGSAYQLTCTARGPALVEYECSDTTGHTKTLRLFGSANWIEVFVNEPSAVYWDFDDPKNFAADGPTPGRWLFSNGNAGLVGREADGVPAQVKAPGTYWGIKYLPDQWLLGLATPETAACHVIAPGAGAGGVGIEGGPAASHFVTVAGRLTGPPAATMDRLKTTLDLNHPPQLRLHALQPRSAAY